MSGRILHQGALFDVYLERIDGREVCVKRLANSDDDRRADALASRWTHSNPTNIFHHRQMGWEARDGRPERAHLVALLRAEHEVLQRVAAEWNHPGTTFGDDELLMPFCAGTTLASLPRDQQRALFPAMLPALWRALTSCPHGDLKADDLLVDPSGQWFRILDPGVCVDGPARRREPGRSSLDFHSRIFTTNLANYPLLIPEHGPAPAKRCAPFGDIASQLAAYHEAHLFELLATEERPSAPATSPAAADVIAMGAIYFSLLTGSTVADVLELDAPLWAGFWSDTGDRPSVAQHCIDAIAGGIFGRALAQAGATQDEIRTCERLLALDISSIEELGR